MADYDMYSSDYNTSAVRSTIQRRNVVINRAPQGSFVTKSVVTRSLGSGMGSDSGAMAGVANSMADQRKTEKREMKNLNERFAEYIERVRFFEAQNRKLRDELEALKLRFGKQTTCIKMMYTNDIDQVKRLTEDCESTTQKLQMQVAAMEEKLDDLKRKYDEANAACEEGRDKLEKQIQQIAEIESEVHLLRMRTELLEGDRKYNKVTLSRLQDSLNKARLDFDAQAAERDAAEARRLTLEEELAFLKELHEQELREMASKAYFDSTASNRESWKSEMSCSLKKMQEEYDLKAEELSSDMQVNYSMQLQALNVPRQSAVSSSKEETTRLKTQTSDLKNRCMEFESKIDILMREIEELRNEKNSREAEIQADISKLHEEIIKSQAELEAINAEVQALTDLKLSLELEICTYKKLLEGEQNSDGLKQVVENMFDSMVIAASNQGAYNSNYNGSDFIGGSSVPFSSNTSYKRNIASNSDSSSHVGGRTSFQRSAKGPISIAECSADGKFIVIENTGKRREDLSGFTLRRNIDGRDGSMYTFKTDAGMDAQSKITIWAKGCKPTSASASDVEADISGWGTGSNITTQLCNAAGQERATHIQKTLV